MNTTIAQFAHRAAIHAQAISGFSRPQTAEQIAYRHLRDEFIEAFHVGPQCKVRTPGGNHLEEPLHSMVYDAMAHPDSGDAAACEIVEIIRMAADGAGSHGRQLHLRASALIATLAAAHAKWHASDAVEAAMDTVL